jgi:hypothetical protein
MCHVHGFAPYFYCTAPDDFADADCAEFMRTLDSAVMGQLGGQFRDVKQVRLHGHTESNAFICAHSTEHAHTYPPTSTQFTHTHTLHPHPPTHSRAR